MDGIKDFIRNSIVVLGSIFTFLGVQRYLGKTIDTYPWAFIVIGVSLMIYAKAISNKVIN